MQAAIEEPTSRSVLVREIGYLIRENDVEATQAVRAPRIGIIADVADGVAPLVAREIALEVVEDFFGHLDFTLAEEI